MSLQLIHRHLLYRVWIVVPFIVTIVLGRTIVNELRAASAARVAIKSI